MAKIKFPLNRRDRGRAVAALHKAIHRLLESRQFLDDDDAARRALTKALSGEAKESTYGPGTARAVAAFQSGHDLEPSGLIDEATAAALGAALAKADRRPPPTPPPAARSRDRMFEVPLFEGAAGNDVALVQDILAGLGHSISWSESQDRIYGKSTAAAVSAWQRQRDLPQSGMLDLEALERLAADARGIPRVVSGVVLLDDATPAPGLRVVAVDRDFRAEQPLGEAVTDRDGRYRIAYKAAAFARVEKGAADLGIKVYSERTLLYEPDARELLMNAPREAVIDVAVAPPVDAVPSEFERIERELRPLVGDVDFAQIARDADSDEGDFLARETGISDGRIAHFVMAHRLAELTKLRPDYFYALLREDGLFGIAARRPRAVLLPVGFAADSKAVLFEAVLLDPDLALGAVRRAVRKRLVHSSLNEEAARDHEALQRWRYEAEAFVREEVPRNILGLVETLIDEGKEQEMLDFLRTLDPADLGGLYDRLNRRGAFAEEAREKAETRLSLGELLGFNVGLIEEVAGSLGVKTPEDLRLLARFQRKDWTDLIVRAGAQLGGRTIEPNLARRQSSIIVRRFEKRYPTAAFTAQLARAKPRAIPDHRRVVEFSRLIRTSTGRAQARPLPEGGRRRAGQGGA